MLHIDDEAARVNPNFASPELVEGLLLATGSAAATAKQLSIAIAEWVGVPVPGVTPVTTAARYQAAGLDYAPPGQPMESLDEIQRRDNPRDGAVGRRLTCSFPEGTRRLAATTVVSVSYS